MCYKIASCCVVFDNDNNDETYIICFILYCIIASYSIVSTATATTVTATATTTATVHNILTL